MHLRGRQRSILLAFPPPQPNGATRTTAANLADVDGHSRDIVNTSGTLGVDVKPPYLAWRFPHLSTADWIIVGTAVFIMVNAVSVCIGWWTRTPILVRLFADDAPTHFNTALAFIFLGLGELGLVLHRRMWVSCAAAVVALLACVELAEFALGVDTGIDTLFAAPFIDADSPHPGRMSANTVACFLLVSGAQVVMSRPRTDTDEAANAAVMLKTIAAGIAFVALLGYEVKLKGAYGWSESVGMSIRSCAAFLLIVGARIAALWKRDIVDQPKLPEWFLPFLATAVISISAGLTWIFNSSEARPFSTDRLYAASARRISVAIEFSLGALILLGTFAVLAARRKANLALHHADELAAQLARLRLLNSITQAIGERQDLASIVQVVIGTLEDQLPIDFGCFCVYQPPETLVIAAVGVKSHDLTTGLGLTREIHVPIDQNGLSRCVMGHVIYEPELAQVHFPFARRLAAGGLSAMIAAPLLVEGQVFGVLIVARRTARSFSAGEREFLKQLTEHVALAAHHAQLYGALETAYVDLRQSQQAMMRQENLRVLGQMASGIAHDINNALSPAALYVEMLLERSRGQSEQETGHLEIVQRAIEGVAQTVARMKEFYSRRDPQLPYAPVSLNTAAEHAIALTRARWNAMPQESGRVIEVRTDLAPDLPEVMGNAGEIRDALTNLILNAVDAMPDGGTITVRSRAPAVDQVQIHVTDTGIGMDEPTRSRCLELFFTTKGERGTGLGLAMVYGTIDRHGGEMQIESEPGAGTTMRLIFPSASAQSTAGDTASTDLRPLEPLRILAVDDDPIILKSLRDSLEGDGHFVAAVDGGQRGIDEFRAAGERNEPYDVVITDLGMPHVDGRTVANAVKAMAPHTPVILLTGWGYRMLAENDTPQQVDRVLSKPPKLTRLRTALAELAGKLPV